MTRQRDDVGSFWNSAAMQRLLGDIKNETYSPVYLLYGEEAYLRIQYKDKLKAALMADGDEMNCTYFSGKDVDPAEVIGLAETMPFLSDRRVIILENTGFVKNGNDALAEYISNGVCDTTVILFAEAEADKRTRLYKAIDKKGRCVSFDRQTEETLKRWVLGRLGKEGKRVTAHTLDVFLETVGDDMYRISGELEKLISYTEGRDTVTERDIEDICSVSLSVRIFDMIEKIARKQGREALKMYHELLSMKESPFGILALLIRQFSQMLTVADLAAAGLSQKQIADRTGINQYVVGKYIPQIRQFNKSELISILESCAQTDQDIKGGRIQAELGVELLIIGCNRGD